MPIARQSNLTRAQPLLTIFLMELLDLESILALPHYVIVELVPKSQCRELWPWNTGDWTKVEAVQDAVRGIS